MQNFFIFNENVCDKTFEGKPNLNLLAFSLIFFLLQDKSIIKCKSRIFFQYIFSFFLFLCPSWKRFSKSSTHIKAKAKVLFLSLASAFLKQENTWTAPQECKFLPAWKSIFLLSRLCWGWICDDRTLNKLEREIYEQNVFIFRLLNETRACRGHSKVS